MMTITFGCFAEAKLTMTESVTNRRLILVIVYLPFTIAMVCDSIDHVFS